MTKRNTNATEILLFLHKIVEVFTEYFKVLEEESIRDNFVIIYELLDEMMDFGYPQTTESKILQEYDQQIRGKKLSTADAMAGTSLKNPTNSKSKPAPQSPSPTPSPGEAKESATARTKSSSTSSNP